MPKVSIAISVTLKEKKKFKISVLCILMKYGITIILLTSSVQIPCSTLHQVYHHEQCWQSNHTLNAISDSPQVLARECNPSTPGSSRESSLRQSYIIQHKGHELAQFRIILYMQIHHTTTKYRNEISPNVGFFSTKKLFFVNRRMWRIRYCGNLVTRYLILAIQGRTTSVIVSPSNFFRMLKSGTYNKSICKIQSERNTTEKNI